MGTIKQLAYRHFELGYTRQLLWIDSFFVLAAAVDGFIYQNTLRLPLFTSTIWSVNWKQFTEGIPTVSFFVLFLLVVAPIGITFLRTIGWTGIFLKDGLASSQKRILMIHIVTCAAFIYMYLVSQNMQSTSGWESGKGNLYHYAFHSYFSALVGSPAFRLIFGSANALVAAGASALLSFVVLGRSQSSTLDQYLLRASLADLAPEYRPTRRSGRFDVPNPGTLTRITFVNDFAIKVLREYQRLGPGTSAGIEYLDRCYSECVGAINDKLLRAPSAGVTSAPIRTQLYTGTKRAFQAALTEMSGPRDIITTPYASPSLLSLLRWHCAVTDDTLRIISFSPDDYDEPWEIQASNILGELKEGKSEQGRTQVLVISEVFYGSGMRVPLRNFIQRVRAINPNGRLHIIVDGTNAVGNRRIVALEPEWDSYVFSPHKWLMATESCGVVLSRGGLSLDRPEAPNAWALGVRKSDTQVRVLAGLRGSMELVRIRGLEYFFLRCEQLRRQFKFSLPRGINVVGEQSGLEETYILSCYPAARHSWKFDVSELEEQISSQRLNASVLPINPLIPWIRVTVPYYLDVREINRISGFLDEVST